MREKSAGGKQFEKGNVAVVILFVLLLTLGVGAVSYLVGSGRLSISFKMQPSPVSTQIPQSNSPIPTASPTQVGLEPMSGWKTYSDKGAKFSFRYPPDISIKENEDGSVSVYLWGPTQKEGTEFYDGINLNFKKSDLGGKTLKQVVDKRVSELSGVFQVGTITQVKISGVLAYKFHVKGFVEGDYYYLSLSGGSYLEIIDSTKDPTGKGFASTALGILGTLKIK